MLASSRDADGGSADTAVVPPAVVSPLLERADAVARGARPSEAVPLYREALAADPAGTEARIRLVDLLARLERFDEALALLTPEPDHPELLVLRGGLLGSLRRHDEAEADLRRVLRLDPAHAGAHLELGRVLVRKGMASQAAAHFRSSTESQPDRAAAYAALGGVLNQTGDLPAARTALERAVELDPRDAKAFHLLGRVYDRLGRPDEARASYQRSRELTGA
jgi:tetratricopeptide (TPR) repeat protein